MSHSLTPRSLKRKLQQIADAERNNNIIKDNDNYYLEGDRIEDSTILQRSPVDMEIIFRHRSPIDILNYSTSQTRSLKKSTNLQNSFNSFHLTSKHEIQHLKLLSNRPAPFPLELLKPNLLVEFFIKGRALEKYFQWRFEDDLKLSENHENLINLKLKPLQRPFVRSSIPSVTFPSYMDRLFRYCQPEPIHLLAIIVYSERLRRNHHLYLPSSGWHRFVVAAWIVSAKALIGDQYWTNQYWARVSGMSVAEICILETELIVILDWHLQICSTEFAAAWNLIKSTKDR